MVVFEPSIRMYQRLVVLPTPVAITDRAIFDRSILPENPGWIRPDWSLCQRLV
jgi:hypothetical protein